MSIKSTQEWKIKELKGVGDVELSLDASKRVFVFFGSNGIGKTKTLEALFLCTLIKNNYFKKKDFLIPYPLFKYVVINGNKIDSVDSKTHFRYLQLQLETDEMLAFAYIGSEQRSRVDTPNKNVQRIGTIEERQNLYFKKIGKAFSTNTLKELGGSSFLNDWFVVRAQASNSFQKEALSIKNEIHTVLKALNKIDSRIKENMEVDTSNNVYLTIDKEERKLTELSSGFISVLKIIQTIVSSYALFSQNENLLDTRGVVFIDEIESHLHVEWQTRIIPTLKELFPNTAFYIATHSPLVLSQLDEGEAYLLKRGDDNVVRSHVIDSPNKRILANVLRDAFDIDLNALKRESMEDSSQDLAKKRLLKLLQDPAGDTSE
ncbi:AAA family ATPase [Psychrobacter sp. AOP22-C1-C5]|uniref:AAA family ATPase n=1 Tax=Psychrobacter sp. AOP22-C1-C5 TaxID=3457716 RepID=UPI004035E964